ncbi:VOC family protein [Streptomyces sp. TS71-3]|uniref:VOC family protein n=1 Tax=Streptomyces sp. TS71-3 TaxID=2733862 RepID=UPI001AFD504F|nr:VOC family protein [Streptomyces sp. TS71-3]GHJ34440.1 hypothetical protein Sm713_00490 [Streptomyces sp. TS71-3]
MSTDGIQGFCVETRNYGATAAFWRSFGFRAVLETDHGSGQWQHPAGGPYVFIVERHDGDPRTYPVLGVPDAAAFSPAREPDFAQPFTPQHWGVTQAFVRDPDGRYVSLEAPLPEGAGAGHGGHGGPSGASAHQGSGHHA